MRTRRNCRSGLTRLVDELRKLPSMRDVASDQQNGGLKAELVIDRDTASRLGILPQAIDDTLYDAFGQRQVSTIFTQLNQYHVVLEVDPQFQQNPDSLKNIYVHVRQRDARFRSRPSATSQTSHTRRWPSIIRDSSRWSRSRSIWRRAFRWEKRRKAIRQAEQDIRSSAQHSHQLPGNGGGLPEFACRSEPWLILAAIVTVYIVLGVLYESYIHPITILSTLPSAGVGAILALLLTGNDLGVVALIGIILLIGIVKKNAIMMIDFALEAEREEHKPPEEAILPGVPAALPSHHDDHHGGAAGRPAAGAWAAAPDRNCAIRWASRSSADCWSASCSRSTPRRSSISGSTAWPSAFHSLNDRQSD